MIKRVYLWPRTGDQFISGPGQFQMLWTTLLLYSKLFKIHSILRKPNQKDINASVYDVQV
jgi:hypothetical protein